MGQAADGPLCAAQTIAGAAVAEHGTGNMCAMTAVKIGRAIVGPGIFDVGCIIGVDRVTEHRVYSAAEIRMYRVGVTGIQPGITHGHNFS